MELKIRKLYRDFEEFIILNGFHGDNIVFDSKYTFYRGNVKSQNDTAITKCTECIKSFRILDKKIYSDHCPIHISSSISLKTSLDFINKCVKGVFNYDHLDVNHREKPPFKLSRVDVVKTVTSLNNSAENLRYEISHNNINSNALRGDVHTQSCHI